MQTLTTKYQEKKIKSLLVKLLFILYIQEYMKNGIYVINIYICYHVNIKIRNSQNDSFSVTDHTDS